MVLLQDVYERFEDPAAIMHRARVKQAAARCSMSVSSINWGFWCEFSMKIRKNPSNTWGIISSKTFLALLDIPNCKLTSARRIMAALYRPILHRNSDCHKALSRWSTPDVTWSRSYRVISMCGLFTQVEIDLPSIAVADIVTRWSTTFFHLPHQKNSVLNWKILVVVLGGEIHGKVEIDRDE